MYTKQSTKLLYQNFMSIPLCVNMVWRYNVTSKGGWGWSMMSNCYEKKCVEEVSLGDLWGELGVLMQGCHVKTTLSQTWLIKGSGATCDPYCNGLLSKHPISFKALREILVWRIVSGSKIYVEATLWTFRVQLLQRIGPRSMKVRCIGYGMTSHKDNCRRRDTSQGK